jgi:hypothetical protein
MRPGKTMRPDRPTRMRHDRWAGRLRSCLLKGLILRVVIAVFLVGCASGPDASHYAAVLDELRVPPGWELAHTTVSEPGAKVPCEPIMGSCPAVFRYFVVGGQPAQAYLPVKQMVTDAGFRLEEEVEPGCNGLEGDDRKACFLVAVRGPDLLYIQVFEPGIDVDELGIGRDGHFVVLLRAYAKPQKESVRSGSSHLAGRLIAGLALVSMRKASSRPTASR